MVGEGGRPASIAWTKLPGAGVGISERTKPPVLILDGNQRSALAATRALGKRGVVVITADETPTTLSGASKYCRGTLVYPSPYDDAGGFVEALKREIQGRGIGVMFPMTDVTTQLVLQHRGEFAGVVVPYAKREAFETVSDKWLLCSLAERFNIRVPRTRLVRRPDELDAALEDLAFPVVIKPRWSRIRSGNRWMAPPVEIAHSRREVEEAVSRTSGRVDHQVLIQQYVAGRGQGVFALYGHGRALAMFAHRRLREKPPWGGVSVLSESVPIDPVLREISERILDDVKWHGVAMLEFKVSEDGTPYLIEINGRFWGSLQLAIDAGVDFPWLLYRLATGQRVEVSGGYQVGLRNRWLLGDVDHLYLRLKKGTGLRDRWRAVLEFLAGGGGATRHEVNRWDDWRPFAFELKRYLGIPG